MLVCNKCDLLGIIPAASSSILDVSAKAHPSADPGQSVVSSLSGSDGSHDADNLCFADGNTLSNPSVPGEVQQPASALSIAVAQPDRTLDLHPEDHASCSGSSSSSSSNLGLSPKGLPRQAFRGGIPGDPVAREGSRYGMSDQESHTNQTQPKREIHGSSLASSDDSTEEGHAGLPGLTNAANSRGNPSSGSCRDETLLASADSMLSNSSLSILSSLDEHADSSRLVSSRPSLHSSSLGTGSSSSRHSQAGVSSQLSNDSISETGQQARSEALKLGTGHAESRQLPGQVQAMFADVVAASTVTGAGLEALASAVLTVAGAPALAQGEQAAAIVDLQPHTDLNLLHATTPGCWRPRWPVWEQCVRRVGSVTASVKEDESSCC